MTEGFNAYFNQHQRRINQYLIEHQARPIATSDVTAAHLSRLYEASAYAVNNGGKRVRPLLVYATARAVDPEYDSAALDAMAASVEMLHSYSLIHDDLPAMDDDDMRRGKPSCHIAFDEATAILAGDGLQAGAFETLAHAAPLSAEARIEAIQVLANAAGNAGMVGGQAMDIAVTERAIGQNELTGMHQLKTGALINAAIAFGAIATAANSTQRAALNRYGEAIGLAFQIADDILDVHGSTAVLGKTGGKDAVNNKVTYVQLLGVEGATAAAKEQLALALDALSAFGQSADVLRQLAHYIVNRDH